MRNCQIHILLFIVFMSGGIGVFGSGETAVYPVVTITTTGVNCNGGSNGTATAAIAAGSTPSTYTVAWSTGANNLTLVGLQAGVYSVTVTEDATGYVFFDAAVVDEPAILTSSTVVTDVNCKTQSTGAVSLTPMGGTSPYNYNWKNSLNNTVSTSQNLTGAPADLYTLTLGDSKGCTHTKNINISEPASAMNNSVSGLNVSCKFGSDGSVNLTVWGATPPYVYNWNAGAFLTEDLSNIAAGTYSVVATDALGCTISNSLTITEPNLLTTTVSALDVLCFGGATGSIDLNVSGGSTPYSYSWTNSNFALSNSQDLFNIPKDNYSVTVTDAKGCTANNGIAVAEPPDITISSVVTYVTCYGISNGAIDLTVLGGTPILTFAWKNTNGPLAATNEDLANIPAQTYTMLATDGNACQDSITLTVIQPLTPLKLAYSQTNILCFGNNTGAIDLTVFGGTPGYSATWTNGATTQDISSLIAGSYQVTIADTNGCIEIENVVLTQPAAPLSTTNQITHVTCFGFSNGLVNLTTSGGTTPYKFGWQNSVILLSVSTEDLVNFPAETYVLTLTDKNNCIYKDTFVVTQPTELVSLLNPVHINCYGDATGAIDLVPTGGTNPVGFLWSNGSVTEDLSSLISGLYQVTLTDSNNCVTVDSVMLTQPDTSLYATWSTVPVTCFGGQDGEIDYDLNGGSIPYNYFWSNGLTSPDMDSLTGGDYIVNILDAKGCTRIDTVNVPQPNDVLITEVIADVSCFGFEDGDIDLTVSGSNPPYSFQWANTAIIMSVATEDLIGFPAELYTVTVTDTMDCQSSKSFILPQPDLIQSSIVHNDITCYGGNDGWIDISVIGGIQPYTYLWSNGDVVEDPQTLFAGMHSVIVSDSNACIHEDSIRLTQPDSIEIFGEITKVSCIDQSDGRIMVTATGGNGGYQYLWSNSEITRTVLNLASASYTIGITDIMGCQNSTSFFVDIDPVQCLRIPSAFTPNADGMNDTWILGNIELYPDANVQVMSIWGERVFNSTPYPAPWDGNFHGDPLPAHTYYYVIDLRNGTAPHSGPVTIVR